MTLNDILRATQQKIQDMSYGFSGGDLGGGGPIGRVMEGLATGIATKPGYAQSIDQSAKELASLIGEKNSLKRQKRQQDIEEAKALGFAPIKEEDIIKFGPNGFEVPEHIQNGGSGMPTHVPPSPTPSPAPKVIDELINQPQVQGTQTQSPSLLEDMLNYTYEQAIKRGFHPSAPVSQVAAESGRGTSNFAKTRNNWFGLGAFDNDLNNTWKFKDPRESTDAYFNVMETDPRYATAYEYRHDPLRFLQEIKKAGYASDPNYVNTISNTPEYRRAAESTPSATLLPLTGL